MATLKTTSSLSVLKISNLKVAIADKEILKGISLTVKPGEIHAIMGPNGSGKSTLAYTLAGHPDYVVLGAAVDGETNTSSRQKSSLQLDGQELLELSPDERAQAGLFLAFQYPVEIPGVKVQNFLRHAYESRFVGVAERMFKSVLEFRKHLETLADEFQVNRALLKRGLNEGFSGGEKKRLEILQMATLEPKYAILDETDSGLDIDAIKVVAAGVVKNVEKYNTGILIITHYQRILEYVKPDFVHVLVNGEIVESGGPELVTRLEKDGYKQWTTEQ